MSLRASLIATAILFSACQTPASPVSEETATPEWRSVTEQELNTQQLDRLATARQARAALGATLMQTVAAASQQGFDAGIAACRDDAPRLAAEASTDGLRLGRTSLRLRNPLNVPPEWATQHVEAEGAEPALFTTDDGRIAELVPIMTAGLCLNCHGPAETLESAVVARLTELYPQDQAVGFAEGDLRGWFWLETDSTL